MPLTQQDIEELKQIHQKNFGETLSDDEAWEIANRLLRFFDFLLSSPVRESDNKGSNRVAFD